MYIHQCDGCGRQAKSHNVMGGWLMLHQHVVPDAQQMMKRQLFGAVCAVDTDGGDAGSRCFCPICAGDVTAQLLSYKRNRNEEGMDREDPSISG